MTSLVFGIYWLWNVMNNWIGATSFSVGKHVAFELPALHSRAFPIGPWSVSSKVCYRGMGCVSTDVDRVRYSVLFGWPWGSFGILSFWNLRVDFQRISGVFIFHSHTSISTGSRPMRREFAPVAVGFKFTDADTRNNEWTDSWHTLTKSYLSVLFPQRRWPPGHVSEVVWKHL